MSDAPRRHPWPRFNLRILLFWIVPFVAVAAVIAAWHGPYRSEFLNQLVRWSALFLWWVVWGQLFLSAYSRDSDGGE